MNAPTTQRRRWAVAAPAALLAVSLMAGCAGLRSVASDVSSFGDWPAERKPGSYAFERLPSQQAQPEATARLEDAARAALAQAGFSAAASGQTPDLLVQVAARSTRTDARWDDALWWRGGFGVHRVGPWGGPRWAFGPGWDMLPRYEREVAVLLRDRASGRPLWEARASNDGSSMGDAALLAAMFQAALMDFPRPGLNPRRVVVTLPG